MFEIIINDDFLFSSIGENYTCGMCCKTSKGAFPDEEWTDFAGILLFEWSKRIMSACRFQDACFNLMFMDGPYEIVGHRKNDTVQLDFYRNGSSGRILEQSEGVDIRELARAMYQAVIRLNKALYLAGYDDAGGGLKRLMEEWKIVLNELKME